MDQLCDDCPREGVTKDMGGFQWLGRRFSLPTIFRILQAAPREAIPINRKMAVGFGLIIEPEQIAEERDMIILGARNINEAHLEHLPQEVLQRPGIVGPVIIGDAVEAKRGARRGGSQSWEGPEASYMLVDGGHRLTKLFRAGAETCLVYPLTAVEMVVAQGYTLKEAERAVKRSLGAFKDWPSDVRLLAGVEGYFIGPHAATFRSIWNGEKA